MDTTGGTVFTLGDHAYFEERGEGVEIVGREIEVYTIGQVTCRTSQKEAEDYYRHAIVESADWGAIDSMLKNEPFDEMYAALRFSEGAEWLNEYNKAFQTIKPWI